MGKKKMEETFAEKIIRYAKEYSEIKSTERGGKIAVCRSILKTLIKNVRDSNWSGGSTNQGLFEVCEYGCVFGSYSIEVKKVEGPTIGYDGHSVQYGIFIGEEKNILRVSAVVEYNSCFVRARGDVFPWPIDIKYLMAHLYDFVRAGVETKNRSSFLDIKKARP